MTPTLNSLSHFPSTSSSSTEKNGNLLATPDSTILSGREVRVLSNDDLNAGSILTISNPASSSAAAITEASVSQEAPYIGLLQQNGFQQGIAKGSAKSDMLYSDVYTKTFEFLTSFKEKVFFVKDAHQMQRIVLSYSQAIRIASESCKELSDADIIDLIEMAPACISPSFRKKIVLGALNPKILTKLTLKTNLLNADELKALFSKSPQLTKFDLSDQIREKKLIDCLRNFLLAIITAPNFHIEAIKELNLSNTNIDEPLLKDLLKNAPNIESLNLSECRSITGESLADLESLQHLKVLNLSGTSITKEGLHLILSKCPFLEELNASSCVSITGEFLANIKSLQHLKVLNLKNTSITEESLRLILSKCPHLEELNACECRSITGESLADIESLLHLKILNLSGSSIIEEGLNTILSKCPNLETLDLSWCKSITGESLDTIESLKHLKILYLSYSGVVEEGLSTILSKCPTLKILYLIDFQQITGKSLANVESLKHLKILSLSYSGVTEEGLKHLLSKCLNLETLDLSYCASITGESLSKIERLKYLKVLRLLHSPVSKELQQQIQEKHPDLKIKI
jgi:hypothetical protein